MKKKKRNNILGLTSTLVGSSVMLGVGGEMTSKVGGSVAGIATASKILPAVGAIGYTGIAVKEMKKMTKGFGR